MFGIGWPEMALILAVALIFIGPKKLPDLAKTLGRALSEFKKVTDDFKESISMDSTLNEVKDEFKDLGKKVKDPLEKKTTADTNTSEAEPFSETDEGESNNAAAEAEETTPPDATSDSDDVATSDIDSDATSDSDSDERAQSFLSDVYAPPSQEETNQTATETENTEASDDASEPDNTPADPTDSEDTPPAPPEPDEISPDVPTEGQLKDA